MRGARAERVRSTDRCPSPASLCAKAAATYMIHGQGVYMAGRGADAAPARAAPAGAAGEAPLPRGRGRFGRRWEDEHPDRAAHRPRGAGRGRGTDARLQQERAGMPRRPRSPG
eukprot:scaffold113909_cov60-Phaeocystis_antarctica.AAC.2